METLIFLTTDRATEDGPDLKVKASKRGTKGRKPKGLKEKFLEHQSIILMVIVGLIPGLAFWALIDGTLRPWLDEFTRNALTSFVSLLVIPAMFLVIKISPRKLELGKLDKGFLISLLVYQVFGIWIIAYFWVDPHYFKTYDLMSWEYLSYVLLVSIYVAPVDFVTRRFIQHEFALEFGAWNGFGVGTVAWLLVHVFEFVWLSELMGPVGSAAFIITSGLLTGLLYMKYKNVLALMLGHWTMNIVISIVTSSLALKGT